MARELYVVSPLVARGYNGLGLLVDVKVLHDMSRAHLVTERRQEMHLSGPSFCRVVFLFLLHQTISSYSMIYEHHIHLLHFPYPVGIPCRWYSRRWMLTPFPL